MCTSCGWDNLYSPQKLCGQVSSGCQEDPTDAVSVSQLRHQEDQGVPMHTKASGACWIKHGSVSVCVCICMHLHAHACKNKWWFHTGSAH